MSHLRFTLSISLLGLSLACHSAESLFVPIDTFQGADLLFFLLTDPAGNIVRTEGPALLGEMSSKPFAGAGSEREGDETWIVTYRESDLERVFPLYDPAGRATMHLGVDSLAGCDDASLDPQSGTAGVLAPTPAGLWRLGESGAEPQDVETSGLLKVNALTLRLRFDGERCIEPAYRTLTTFAAAEVPVPVGTVIQGRPQVIDSLLYASAHRLGDDRLLLMSSSWLFLLERGGVFEASASTVAPVGPRAIAFLVDEHPSRHGGGVRIVATAERSGDFSPRWHELELGPDGLRLVSTATLASTVTGLTLDADTGRVVAVTNAGEVLSQSARGEPLVIHGARFAFGDDDPMVTRTGWPSWPYALAGAARDEVVALSPDLDRTQLLTTDGVDGPARYGVITMLGTPEGPRLFVANNKGQLHGLDRERDRWVRHPMRFPPDYECGARGACGFNLQGLTLRGLVPHRRGGVERFYAVMNDCMTVLDVRIDGLCGGYLRLPGRTDLRPLLVHPETADDELFNVRAIHLSASGWLTVASQDGGVYEMFTGSEPSGLD